jgi:uncharacterized protein
MRPFRPLGLLVSVALGLASVAPPPSWAGVRAGLVAYKQGDFATALHEFLPLAEQGDREAQFYLGTMYTKGWGVSPNPGEAARWYQQAARQGVAEAQYNLGVMYTRGEGVPQDLVQAYLWLALAAGRFPRGESHTTAVQTRDRVAAQLTPEQWTQAQALVRQWTAQPAP